MTAQTVTPSHYQTILTLVIKNLLKLLLNTLLASASWPDHYKVEYVTPIGKVPKPESEDNIRPISLTNFFSKVMEHFVRLGEGQFCLPLFDRVPQFYSL